MERIGGEIEKELAKRGDHALGIARVTEAWPEAVGDAVARQAWPQRIGRDGTLHVAASSATWAFELDRLGSELLERLAAVLGSDAPAKVRVRVGPVPEPGAPLADSAPRPPEPPEVPAETAEEAHAAASAIEDPELRELVARAARASLLRARSSRRF